MCRNDLIMVAALENGGKNFDTPINVGSLWNLWKLIDLHLAKRVPS